MASRRSPATSSAKARSADGQRTVICTSTGAEKLIPLLLADTVTVLVPRGQVIVDPGPVPQPPVHERVTNGQLDGSEKPSCAAVSVALPDAPASRTTDFDPVKTGSVRWTAVAASTRPDPERLSGCPVVVS